MDTYKMCMYLEIGMQNKTHLQNRKYAVAWELILYPGTHSFLSNSHIGSYGGKMNSPGSYEKNKHRLKLYPI